MKSTIYKQASSFIPLSEPLISGNEWKYIKDCLDTGWVSSVGEYVNRFEKMVADYVGTKHAVATVNGTSAIHVSLIASGVQADDEVIVPALTFIAPVNAVMYCNARPVFMDCDSDTFCLDVEKLATFLENESVSHDDGYRYNKISKKRIKAIIPVHVFGHPARMDELLDICQRFNMDIIEDATESIGSEYKKKRAGSFGKTGCFSFNGNKIITTGGGGMVVTNDGATAIKIRHLTTQAKCDSMEYDHDEIGYNYRLTNLQAAMGVAQLERLDEFVDIKRKNAAIYKSLLEELSEVEFLWERPDSKSNFWFYTIKVSRKHKQPLMKYLLSENIQVRPIWKLIHSLPMYSEYQAYKIEKGLEAYECCLNLPCSLRLKEDEIHYVVDKIKKYFKV